MPPVCSFPSANVRRLTPVSGAAVHSLVGDVLAFNLEEPMRWSPMIGVTAALLAVATACTHQQREDTEETADAVAEETAEAAATVAEETQEMADEAEDVVDDEVTVELASLAAGGASGQADLRRSGESWRVEIEMTGLAAGEQYAADLHQGACAAGGASLARVGAFTGADGGVTGAVPLDAIVSGRDYSIRVTSGGAVVACGDLPDVEPSVG